MRTFATHQLAPIHCCTWNQYTLPVGSEPTILNCYLGRARPEWRSEHTVSIHPARRINVDRGLDRNHRPPREIMTVLAVEQLLEKFLDPVQIGSDGLLDRILDEKIQLRRPHGRIKG